MFKISLHASTLLVFDTHIIMQPSQYLHQEVRRIIKKTSRTILIIYFSRSNYNVQTFLKTIGRNCESFADKFETWEQLFTTPSRVMKNDMGIDTKSRKYILSWIERYRKGVQPYSIALPKK
ncbi:unnamed protein product [Rhizopus microsporus]